MINLKFLTTWVKLDPIHGKTIDPPQPGGLYNFLRARKYPTLSAHDRLGEGDMRGVQEASREKESGSQIYPERKI